MDKTAEYYWWLFGLLAILIVFAVLVLSCPDEEAHKSQIKGRVSRIMDDVIDENVPNEGLVSGGINQIGKMIAAPLVNGFIDNRLHYHNYIILSTMTYEDGKKDIIVSVGFLGRVNVTLSQEQEEQLKRKAKEFIEQQTEDGINGLINGLMN